MDGWTPNFSWITPDLAVGGSFPAGVGARLAREHGIAGVIDVRTEACDDAEELEACGLRFLHLPTQDMFGVSQPMLDAGVAFAAEIVDSGGALLIHCEHGIGRSATLALCVLVDRGMAPMEALSLAKDSRNLVSPSQSQYEAWIRWIERRAPQAAIPSFHEFGMIAYRHLAQSA
jgi:protein-tyrosine phosphatase